MTKTERKRRLRVAVMARDLHRCVRCEAEGDLTIDHVVPVTWGGSDSPQNLQTLCRSCNSYKSDRAIRYVDGETSSDEEAERMEVMRRRLRSERAVQRMVFDFMGDPFKLFGAFR